MTNKWEIGTQVGDLIIQGRTIDLDPSDPRYLPFVRHGLAERRLLDTGVEVERIAPDDNRSALDVIQDYLLLRDGHAPGIKLTGHPDDEDD